MTKNQKTSAKVKPVAAEVLDPAPPSVSGPENKPQDETTGKDQKASEPAYPAFLKQYLKLYPKNRVFYVTTDKMVFLEKDRSLALLHQNTLKDTAGIETYKI